MIEALTGQGGSPKRLCRLLDVAPSGFYYWRSKPPSIRDLRREQLSGLIVDIHHASRGTYGYRRVTAELRIGHEVIANHKAVAALMRSLGLHGLPARKPRRKGPGGEGGCGERPRAAPVLRRGPEPLVDDGYSRASHQEGKLYCCAVLDAYSRSVVGWSIDNQQAASLVTSALGMAISRREPQAGGIAHSDHGSQFTSWAFSERVKAAGLALSMGRMGDAFENAMMESFWARMQTELLNRQRWRTRLELANAIFEYLEIFHNRKRRHSSLGMLTPAEYDSLHIDNPAA